MHSGERAPLSRSRTRFATSRWCDGTKEPATQKKSAARKKPDLVAIASFSCVLDGEEVIVPEGEVLAANHPGSSSSSVTSK